ncbi:Uncharacterised protein [BD1-7 clade bacterium]|uniref:Thioredoxin-like fold domain-containing protein n=1 Tax=BD1-7 clade bacterium TaxID=2029982 RepID=A0A5S9PWZ4_9GAMM|nr:Uncharacterised protein [BD1-7 clade bacterium]CAA0113257.1 Uncharacterised protein [BD1-7 clade bacterium]
MHTIKVLGTGCKKCQKVYDIIDATRASLSVETELQKEENAQVIMQYGVMKTPAVVVDEKVVFSGNVPTADDVKSWF